MHLLDKDGKFQFVRNSIVKIDPSLPKYERLAKLAEEDKAKEKAARIKREHDVKVAMESGASETELIGMMQEVEDDYVAPRTKADNICRDAILKEDVTSLREYLGSEDASDFNAKFCKILSAEVDTNSYSFQIGSHNIIAYNTPLLIDENVESKDGEKKEKRDGLITAISKWWKDKKKAESEEVAAKEDALSVLDFFETLHMTTAQAHEFKDKLDGYFTLIDNAATMHQTAQLDNICQRIIIDIYESILNAHGYNRYVDFTELEKMKSNGKRVVDIDYVENFNRLIPSDVVDKKKALDAIGVFDNYCVMYYDPSGASYDVTSSAKRDPILFGLINHSPRLYYIGDWVDDLCDLTLEKVAELASVGTITDEKKED